MNAVSEIDDRLLEWLKRNPNVIKELRIHSGLDGQVESDGTGIVTTTGRALCLSLAGNMAQLARYGDILQLANGLFYEREALGEMCQTTTFTLYNLGNEMSLVCGWLPRTWGKYILTGEIN